MRDLPLLLGGKRRGSSCTCTSLRSTEEMGEREDLVPCVMSWQGKGGGLYRRRRGKRSSLLAKEGKKTSLPPEEPEKGGLTVLHSAKIVLVHHVEGVARGGAFSCAATTREREKRGGKKARSSFSLSSSESGKRKGDGVSCLFTRVRKRRGEGISLL